MRVGFWYCSSAVISTSMRLLPKHRFHYLMEPSGQQDRYQLLSSRACGFSFLRGFRTAEGGWPGGGAGHGGNPHWAAGGGGGYSMVAKKASSNTRSSV